MPSTRDAARTASRSTALRTLARVGYVAAGVLHILIGILAISVALSSGGGNADQQGALAAIADAPAGAALLWVMGVGLAALALWNLAEAVLARGGDRADLWKDRVKHVGIAVAYGFLAVLTVRYALGDASGGGDQGAQSASATLLAAPGGVVLLLLGAAVVAGIGIAFVVRGARRKFLEHLAPPPKLRAAVTALGVGGYIAKGVALVVVGILLGVAAVTADPEQAAGLDGALKTLASLPFGQVLLVAIGLGFIAYGVFCILRARYAKL